ncbi:MAG: polyprenyl synthetase family protein [bacterium]|nr:polyprenyl synthetase family protein [bacterium]
MNLMYSYQELLGKINQKIVSSTYGSEPKELYEPIDYMMSLGGKRLRPVLTLMACDLFSKDIEKALDAALAVEVFHNFTLVHDDIMDNAPLRRGKETIYQKWNMPVAILSGDLMMIKSIDLLAKTEGTNLAQLINVFSDAAAQVCEGQQIDMNFETQQNVSHAAYIEMITLKTAVLLGCSLKLGALIGGANEQDAQHLYEFGKCIGIAFQIQDDILDSFGEVAQVGKRIGGDIASNKKTLLLIELIASAQKDDLNLLQELFVEPNEKHKISGVLNLYNKYQIRAFAENEKQQYLKKAYEHMDAIGVGSNRKMILIETAKDLMERMS